MVDITNVYSHQINRRGNMNEKLPSMPSQNARTDDEEQKRKELLQLLQSWLEEDEQEQKETLDHLRQALDLETIDNPLPNDKWLIRPLVVQVQRGDGEVLVSEP